MTTEEISIYSSLTQERANKLQVLLAIKNEDEFHIRKMMEYADKGLTDLEILQLFCANNYWLHIQKLS